MTVKFVHYRGLNHRILRFSDGTAKVEIVQKGMFEIAEIIGLDTIPELTELDLSRNKLLDINGLESLVNLRILRLSSNQISEISGLESLVNLEELYLNGNQIKEITGLEKLRNLKVLDLSNNEIPELEALDELTANLPNLEYLHVKGNPAVPEERKFENRSGMARNTKNDNVIIVKCCFGFIVVIIYIIYLLMEVLIFN